VIYFRYSKGREKPIQNLDNLIRKFQKLLDKPLNL
jgi:hypothetical protein